MGQFKGEKVMAFSFNSFFQFDPSLNLNSIEKKKVLIGTCTATG